jgi:predicted ATP-dependent protease
MIFYWENYSSIVFRRIILIRSEGFLMNNEEYENMLSINRVPVSKLRSEFDSGQFTFETTNDLKTLPNEMIGQQRAKQAMEFGLAVEQKGYNLFVVGPAGTGRVTYTQDSVAKMAKNRTVPNDICYVYNFDDPDLPLVISFTAGHGQEFQHKMETLLIDIEREIRSTFSGEVYEKRKQLILEDYRAKVDELWAKADAFALEQNYKIERTPAGVNTYPLLLGKPMDRKNYESLSEAEKDKITIREKQVEAKIRDTLYLMRKMDEQLRVSMDKFMRHSTADAIAYLFQPLRETYQDHPKVLSYLEAYFHDVVVHFSFFLAQEEDENNIMNALVGSKEQQLNRYTVNLFVNNKNLTGAPVIYETNPTYFNLFGKVEYKGTLGSWVTDFTHIKRGVLHLANGGYLILQASELLQQPEVWTMLKRALQTWQYV